MRYQHLLILIIFWIIFIPLFRFIMSRIFYKQKGQKPLWFQYMENKENVPDEFKNQLKQYHKKINPILILILCVIGIYALLASIPSIPALPLLIVTATIILISLLFLIKIFIKNPFSRFLYWNECKQGQKIHKTPFWKSILQLLLGLIIFVLLVAGISLISIHLTTR